MHSTFDGIKILSSEHKANVLFSIKLIFESLQNDMVRSLKQSANADSPIYSTFLGILIFVNDVHENEDFSILKSSLYHRNKYN